MIIKETMTTQKKMQNGKENETKREEKEGEKERKLEMNETTKKVECCCCCKHVTQSGSFLSGFLLERLKVIWYCYFVCWLWHISNDIKQLSISIHCLCMYVCLSCCFKHHWKTNRKNLIEIGTLRRRKKRRRNKSQQM